MLYLIFLRKYVVADRINPLGICLLFLRKYVVADRIDPLGICSSRLDGAA